MNWMVISVIVVLFFLWRSSAKKNATLQKFSVFDLTNPWLEENGFIPDSARFNVYYGRPYTIIPDGAVIVGFVTKSNGKNSGFVCDVSQTMGCMGGHEINQTAASYHKRASMQSMQSRVPMSSILREASREFDGKRND